MVSNKIHSMITLKLVDPLVAALGQGSAELQSAYSSHQCVAAYKWAELLHKLT